MDVSPQLSLSHQQTPVNFRHEAQLIRQSISEAEKDLQQINNDIEKLLEHQEQLSRRVLELKERKLGVAGNIARLQIAVAPHRMLPEDILSHIFIVCSRLHGPVHLPLGKINLLPPQLILSHVCRTWRRVALATRELWADIHILQLEAQGRKDPSRSRRISQRWLSRAGSHRVALSLDLERIEAFSSRSIGFIDVVREFILPLRIGRLQLQGDHRHFSILSQMPHDALSDIEELHISFRVGSITAFPDMPLIINKTRSVRLLASSSAFNQNNFDQLMQGLSLPWSQLRRFSSHISTISISQWIRLFQQTPLLEECNLEITATDTSGEEELVLDRLREFNLCAMKLTLDEVIRRLKFPNLRRLSLRDCSRWTTETYKIIQRQYNLGQLEEFECDAYPLAISTILRDAPMLHHLHLFPGNPVVDDEGVIGISTGQLGRFLVSLRIKCEEADVEEMLHMVEARLRNIQQLINEGCGWKEEFTALRDVTLPACRKETTLVTIVSALRTAGIKVKFV